MSLLFPRKDRDIPPPPKCRSSKKKTTTKSKNAFNEVMTLKSNFSSGERAYALKYVAGISDIESFKKSFDDFTHGAGEKLYINKNNCIGVMATDLNTGHVSLTQVGSSDYVVIRWRYGILDIYVLNEEMFSTLFSRAY